MQLGGEGRGDAGGGGGEGERRGTRGLHPLPKLKGVGCGDWGGEGDVSEGAGGAEGDKARGCTGGTVPGTRLYDGLSTLLGNSHASLSRRGICIIHMSIVCVAVSRSLADLAPTSAQYDRPHMAS